MGFKLRASGSSRRKSVAVLTALVLGVAGMSAVYNAPGAKAVTGGAGELDQSFGLAGEAQPDLIPGFGEPLVALG